MGVLAYFVVLDGVPLAIVLAYNRMAPSSSSVVSTVPRGGRAGAGRGRAAPEEEPLIRGTRGRFADENPFADNRPDVQP